MKLDEIIDHSSQEVSELLLATDPDSVFEDYENFKILLLRRIELTEKHVGFQSEFFILKEKTVYYYGREKKEFTRLEKSYASLISQLEGYYKNNQRIIRGYSSEIERLENYLFDRSLPNVFMDIWFDLKKDLSKLENYYYRNGIVYHEFLKKAEPVLGKLKDEFKDIEDSIQFQTSNINTLKSRLDGVHHYYNSIKNDRLNKTLLSLTIISGIFLPLNLIVGFFGMNTPGLFFTQDEHGTHEVLALLIGVLVACALGIPIVRLADRYILRFILGRYDFYKAISSRIDEIGQRMRVK